jgi:glycosyltransferase involved in cell wall biosynthesis
MKFAFFPEQMASFHGHSLNEIPLGGMETAVIRLTEALHDLGHQVTVFSNHENPPLSKPLYLPRNALNHLGEVDCFIGIRDWRTCFLPVKANKIFFWTGDNYDLPQNLGIGDKRVVSKIDRLLAVSAWHAEKLCYLSGFPKEKAYVLRNGVCSEYFKERPEKIKKRLIYSSTPYRGLKFLPQIFKSLKEKHPELELHIFSDYKVYGENANQAYAGLIAEFNLMKEEFSKIDACHLHGNVKQSQLAKEMLISAVLAYPNTFEETSCITAMEAQAAGCVVITSNLGALPETIGDAGIVVREKPGTPQYIESWCLLFFYIFIIY